MIAIADLHGTAREYLRAAKLLRTRRSYDAAVYLCGHIVEIALHHHQEHQVEETCSTVFNGVSISRAFIITANPSPMPALAQAIAA